MERDKVAGKAGGDEEVYMSKRPKCVFKDCDNEVMRGPETKRLLSVCAECFDANRASELWIACARCGRRWPASQAWWFSGAYFCKDQRECSLSVSRKRRKK